jgi:hypothetical protein
MSFLDPFTFHMPSRSERSYAVVIPSPGSPSLDTAQHCQRVELQDGCDLEPFQKSRQKKSRAVEHAANSDGPPVVTEPSRPL